MTRKRWDGSAWQDINTTLKRWNGSSWVTITLAKRWNGSAWVDITLPGGGGAPLSATVSDTTVFGTEVRIQPPAQPSVISVASDNPANVTVTPAGGTGPYSVVWTHESGDSAVQVLSPLSATTAFIANIGKNQSRTAVKRATVTDSLGATAVIFVTVHLQYILETG